ncbi:hypothetical protein [Pontixanthobacter sp.]|uniref:hypothetical protein n=1 Tax=Pontixanthobacter sp. TaxID=2792078 RepID=UPI003C7D1AE1
MTGTKRYWQFRERYFFLGFLPFAIACEWAFAASLNWQEYPRGEWVALIDLCLFVPLVYFMFFSSALETKPRLIRTVGVAGVGLFAARFIVPEANQLVIADLAYMRNFVLSFVIAFEGWVLYKIITAVYKRNADAKTLEREFAVPEWIAKLMILEARFWKAVCSFFTRK